MIRRMLPSPILSAALLLLWLLLSQSLGAGTLVMGALLAVVLPLFTKGLRPTPVRMKKPLVALRLVRTVVGDMLRSNYAVARALLARDQSEIRSGFIHVPLELRDPNGLAVLAMVVCVTPGMAWAEIAFDRSMLLLHALEMGDDEQKLIDHIKQNYERPLMEIFE